jgi:hypothetical protein
LQLWSLSHKYDKIGAKLADGHYSRRKVGSPQFMPPGDTVVLVRPDAVFGWWRPNPASGIKSMNGLDGWTCSIFRRAALDAPLASELILDAEMALDGWTCGPDGLLTYVWDAKIRSTNPGFCFKAAGWRKVPGRRGKSADGRKTLLWKPWELRGVQASGVSLPAALRHAG